METAKQLRHQKEKLGEAEREIAQLKQELRELHGVMDDVAGGKKRKRASESEEGGKVARLPTEVWTIIAAKIDEKDVLAIALTSKQHREAQQQAGRKLVTRPCYQKREGGSHTVKYFSRDWCAWWSRRFNMTETMPECMNRVIRIAASFGYLDVLKTYWSDIPEDKMPLLMNAKTCARAALGGHLETLQWLRSQGCPWNVDTCAWAAAHGHLKCLQWARSEGCPWSAFTTRGAARRGHLECLQWARENGCPWDANRMCNVAAKHDQLAVLKWVREQGCPWGETATLYAARNGHLNCFRWLIYQGCPWNRESCRSRGSRNIQQWMREQENLK